MVVLVHLMQLLPGTRPPLVWLYRGPGVRRMLVL